MAKRASIRNPVDAAEDAVFKEEVGGGRARRQLIDLAIGGVGDVKRLVANWLLKPLRIAPLGLR